MRSLISRYPTVPKLKGKLGGQIANMSKPNGMIKTLVAASAIAFANKGISYFWVGPEVWLVCTRAEDIKVLIDEGFEKDRVSRWFFFYFFFPWNYLARGLSQTQDPNGKKGVLLLIAP